MVKGIDVEFVSSFPMVSVVFNDVVINDVLDSLKKDRFVEVKELEVRFNVLDILSGEYNVKKILIENGNLHFRINSKGESNYVFWKTSEKESKKSNFNFALNSVEFNNVGISFRNDISRMFLTAKAKEILAKGNFSDKVQNLDLRAKLVVEAFVFDKFKLTYPQSMQFDLEVNNNTLKQVLSVKKADIYLGEMQFDLVGSYLYDAKNEIDIALIGKQIDLKEVFSLLGKDSKTLFNGYESEGLVNFKMSMKGELNKEKLPEINADFEILKGVLRNKKLNINCENINLKGNYTNGLERNSRTSVLKVDNFSFNLNKGFFEGGLVLSNFSDFEIDAKVKTRLNLEDVKAFLKQDSLQVLKGGLTADVRVKTKLNNLKSLDCSGKAHLENVSFKDLRLQAVELDKMSCDFLFDSRKIKVETLSALFNGSKLNVKGEIDNKGVKADVNLASYRFNNVLMEDIKAKLLYADNVISTSDLRFNVFGGGISSNNCKLIFAEKENILNGSCKIEKVNIKRAFKDLENFSQKVITDKNLEGSLSATATLNLHFDKSFNFLSDISSFNVNYSIAKGRLRDFDLMKKLSLFVKEDALKDVRFDNITSSLQLNNSTINFEPITVRSNVVDFECFGKHDLDNKIDYQFAINLLENAEKNSAKVKLFVKVEGLIDNPKFKFNLQSDMKKVKEKVDKDKREIISAIDKDFKLNLEEAKKDKKNWEKQEKGEYIIEWEEENEEVKKEKEFENSEFIIEWED